MDPSERSIRTGELSERALVGAMGMEVGSGRHPSQLAVGSAALERTARSILTRPGVGLGTLDDLRPSLPNVVLDRELPEDGWELRES